LGGIQRGLSEGSCLVDDPELLAVPRPGQVVHVILRELICGISGKKEAAMLRWIVETDRNSTLKAWQSPGINRGCHCQNFTCQIGSKYCHNLTVCGQFSRGGCSLRRIGSTVTNDNFNSAAHDPAAAVQVFERGTGSMLSCSTYSRLSTSQRVDHAYPDRLAALPIGSHAYGHAQGQQSRPDVNSKFIHDISAKLLSMIQV
jgi:hypothetical protein